MSYTLRCYKEKTSLIFDAKYDFQFPILSLIKLLSGEFLLRPREQLLVRILKRGKIYNCDVNFCNEC